jgi:hypothetical protein
MADNTNPRDAHLMVEHPSLDELADFVDGVNKETYGLDIASHVRACVACAGEVTGLRALSAEIEVDRARRPVLAPAPIVLSPQFGSKRIRLRPWLSYAAAAAVVLAVGTVVVRESARPAPVSVANGAIPVGSPAIQPVATLADGGLNVTLTNDGQVKGIETLDPASRELVRSVVVTHLVPMPTVLSALVSPRDHLMGSASAATPLRIVSPAGVVIETDRPTLTWTSIPGATEYRVVIVNSALDVVAESGVLHGLSWMPTEPLARGAMYHWQVTARTEAGAVTAPAPPAPEARFKVLDRARFDRLSAATKTHPQSHLLAGTLCVEAGLLERAEREFAALAAVNPGSPIAAALLEQTKAARQR